MRSLLYSLLLASPLLLSACQTRSSSCQSAAGQQMRLGAESAHWVHAENLDELPRWYPALGEDHRPRGGTARYAPGRPYHLLVNQETHRDQRTRSGRHTLPQEPSLRH